ncbi:unnamed protein product [Paramecium primaurelia]|uniref:Tetratricopeptide repeat protein n=1 Tax=Paramecium primaurelia TaxID=5886 RepID=A0A8S1PYT2_PARPR|nr:unnamed protein product [Paramecium primaurelia]
MEDDSEFLCQQEGHDEDEIIGFCLNNNCKENTQFCLKCCWDKHSSHEEECKTFKQIQKTIISNKLLEEKQHTQLINKMKEIQTLCDQITQHKNVDTGKLQILEKDLKDKEYKKCLEHIPFFKKYCLYLQSNSQQMLLEQLDKGLQTLKLLTLGIPEILEQTKVLENYNSSIKSEIINPNQNQQKPPQVEVQKKDQEVQVNIEMPIQNQNLKQQQQEIEILEKKEIIKPQPYQPTRVGLPPQQINQQPSSVSSYQQPKPSNPPSVSNQSSNIYPPQGSSLQKQNPPQNSINKPNQPPPGSSQINQQPPSNKIPPPVTKPQQLPTSNLHPQQQNAQNSIPQIPKANPIPANQVQIQKNQPQKSDSEAQQPDFQKVMNMINSVGQQGLLKQVIEFSLQQAMEKNAKDNNQPVPKISLTNEQVEYYKGLIESQQLQKQCAELLQKEKYKETIDLIDKANLNAIEDNFEILLIKWKCLIKLNQFEQALETCNHMIENHPEKTQVIPLKGLTLHHLSRYEEAIDFFDIGIELNQNDFNSFFHKGQTLLVLKKQEEAIKCFERAIEIDPENEHSYFLLGNALKKLGQFHQAVQNYNTAININPQHQIAFTFKSQCLIELKVYEEAIRAADAAILINPNNPMAQYIKGVGLLKVEAFKEALDCFEKAIMIEGTMHEAHASKGETLHKMNKFIAAVASYDLALQLSPDPQYMLKKAESLRALEKIEEADILQSQAQQRIDQQEQSKNQDIKEQQQI